MYRRKFETRITEGDEFYSDYETKERLLAPFILIALQGSNKEAVPINVSSLEKDLLIDNLIPNSSPQLLKIFSDGKPIYTVLVADADYTMELPNLIDVKYVVFGVKGYFYLDDVARCLPKVYDYFNPPEVNVNPSKSNVSEDDIQF